MILPFSSQTWRVGASAGSEWWMGHWRDMTPQLWTLYKYGQYPSQRSYRQWQCKMLSFTKFKVWDSREQRWWDHYLNYRGIEAFICKNVDNMSHDKYITNGEPNISPLSHFIYQPCSGRMWTQIQIEKAVQQGVPLLQTIHRFLKPNWPYHILKSFSIQDIWTQKIQRADITMPYIMLSSHALCDIESHSFLFSPLHPKTWRVGNSN